MNTATHAPPFYVMLDGDQSADECPTLEAARESGRAILAREPLAVSVSIQDANGQHVEDIGDNFAAVMPAAYRGGPLATQPAAPDSLAQLCAELHAFCARHKLPQRSADELAADPRTPEPLRDWLHAFCARWDAAADADARAAAAAVELADCGPTRYTRAAIAYGAKVRKLDTRPDYWVCTMPNGDNCSGDSREAAARAMCERHRLT